MSIIIEGPRATPESRDAAVSRPPAASSRRSEAPTPAAVRLVSLDAFRGLVMVLMVSAGLRIGDVVKNFDRVPEWRHLHTSLWDRLAYQTDHSPWVGCSLWDLIQPAFMFMVGAALAFSVANRKARGQSFARMLSHAIVRAVVLVLLGVFLMSNWGRHTNWIFTNVLSQIGLGYAFLFLLAWTKPKVQLVAAVLILVACWAAFAAYPKPAPDVPSTQIGLPADWPRLGGFAAHWEKNTNIATRFDQWFLNLFPRNERFVYESGGYATVNFLPSLATMIFGLLAGELVRSRARSRDKLLVLVGAGIAALVIGWGLGMLGVCPVVKRIWTPSWAIFSTGWVFLALAAFYWTIDVAGQRAWTLPLVVVGMNSIAIYCMSMLLKPWVRETITRHFGSSVYDLFGKPYTPMLDAALFLIFCWIVCGWMYRQKIFIRI